MKNPNPEPNVDKVLLKALRALLREVDAHLDERQAEDDYESDAGMKKAASDLHKALALTKKGKR